MRVLVTGGAGFIGSHIVDRYLEGGWDVTVLDDLSTGRRENVAAPARLIVGDIAAPGLTELLAGVEFDLVNHQAAQIDVRVSVGDPKRDARINLIGLLNLLELVRARGTPPVVFASSGGVMYGEAEVVPTPEGSPKLLFSPYGVSKLASEYYLQYYALVHDLRYVALRYGNVYGPRQNPEGEAGVVSIFIGNLLQAKPLTIYGTGEQDRDFVYVKDVAEANSLVSQSLVEPETDGFQGSAVRELDEPSRHSIAAAPGTDRTASGRTEEPVDGPALNVGTSRAVRVLDLVQALQQLTGRRLEVRHAAARTGELLHSTLDCSKIARRVGWKARTSLVEGLEETYRHFASLAGVPA
jgi:UDP-glucose 4-epimerase